MKLNNNYELIKDYLDGTLESKTSKEIEKLLREDEVARNIAKGILILDKHFHQDEEKIEDYLDRLQTRQTNRIKSHTRSGGKFTFLKIAASIALLILASISIYQYASPDMEDYLAAQLSEPYQAPSITRSAEGSDDNYLSGMAYYRNQKYEEAYSRLSTLNTPVSLFYGGLCKLYLGDYDTAINLLNDDQLRTGIFSQQSKWYLSLAYIKTGQNEQAMKLLTEISQQNGFKQEEAKKMMSLLKGEGLQFL